MKWRISAMAIGIAVVVFIGLANRKGARNLEMEVAQRATRSASGGIGGSSSMMDGPSRTKASQRATLPPPASHSAQQLKDFILPDISIQGVGLDAALQQVRAAYEKTCLETGESPLTLKFTVPPESGRLLRVSLKGQNVTQSIRLLAALAGTKLVRDGVEFRFVPIPEDGKLVKKVLRFPPDFNSALDELSGTVLGDDGTGNVVSINDPNDPSMFPVLRVLHESGSAKEIMEKLGLNLDPATNVVVALHGELMLETTCSADAAAVEELVKLMGENKPKQLKYTGKTIELPADSDWKMPDLKQLDDAEMQLMMRELAQTAGAELMTMPSVTGRFGQGTKIEIVKDLLPSGGEAAGSEPLRVGITMDLQGDAIGFGQNVAFDFQNIEGAIDPASGQPAITRKSQIASTLFCKDGKTMLSVERRPDGSRVVLMVNTAQIDATGRPVH